jgi:hypothetical protein
MIKNMEGIPLEEPTVKDESSEEVIKEEFLEKQEDEPEFHIRFAFNRHGTAEDARSLVKDNLDWCDVYIPEAVRWTKDQLRLTREVSMGELEAKDIVVEGGHDFTKEVFSLIEGSNKLIYFVDIPKELDEIGYKIYEHMILASEAYLKGDYEAAIKNGKNFIKAQIEADKVRENHMLKELDKLKSTILDENPILKNKEKINILMTLGLAHLPIYSDFKKQQKGSFKSIEKKIPNIHAGVPLFNYATMLRLSRQVNNIPEGVEQLSNKEVMRALTGSIINELIVNYTFDDGKHNEESNILSDFLVEQLNDEDIKHISESAGRMSKLAIMGSLSEQMKLKIVAEVLAQKAKEKDFDLPLPRTTKIAGRNESCPCGTGEKYKKCCDKENVQKKAYKLYEEIISGKRKIRKNSH